MTATDLQTDNLPHAHAQEQHHAERQQELAKLRAIESKVQQIHDKVATRLPLQRRHLAARVCGAVWAARARLARLARASAVSGGSDTLAPTAAVRQEQRQQAAQQMQQHIRQLAKKLRMELGAFDYQAKEQGELLTRQLCELDDILSFGDAEIKCARKALVVAIQRDALPLADALREQSARLKALGEALLATLPQPDAAVSVAPVTAPVTAVAEPAATPTASSGETTGDVEMSSLDADDNDGDNEARDDDSGSGSEDEDMDAADADSDSEVRSGGSDAESDELDGDDSDGDDSDGDAEADSDGEEEDIVVDDMCGQKASSRAQQQPPAQQRSKKPAVDVQALPVWRPYYQLQKRRDGLYLVANLHDVEPANVHVQWLEHAGVLRISGYKLPTQKDLALTRFSGVPTFGRFEIAERLPVDVLAMGDATQALRADGTLEIRMPFDAAPRWPRQRRLQPAPLQLHPSLFGRSSLLDAPRCMVW